MCIWVGLSLKEMADYWRNLAVPDAIGTASPQAQTDENEQVQLDWSPILSGGDSRPNLNIQRSQKITPSIQRTWDMDSVISWASCLSINRGLYVSYLRQLQGILEAAFMSSTKEQLYTLSLTFDWAVDANLLNLAYMFSSPESPTSVERLLTLLKTNGGCGSTNFFCPRFVAVVHLM